MLTRMDVPHELAALPNWVRWDESKIPLQADGITRAKSNDPSTWARFEDVQAFDRIGFMFRKEDGIVGIDLDGAIGPDGEIAKWALRITELFKECYIEESPSGLGIHIICKGNLPNGMKGRKVKLNETKTSDKQPGIEIYDKERYFTFTGQGQGSVSPAGDRLGQLLAQYWPAPIPKASQASVMFTTGHDVADRARKWLANKPGTQCGTASCHDHTFHAAQALVNGFKLSDDMAFALLVEWCDKGTHRWTETELNHKINQAHAAPCDKPDGWLLVDNRDSLSSFSHSLALPTVVPVVPPAAEPPPAALRSFPAKCLQAPGLIGEILSHTLSTAIYPQPELSLAGALALMSLITGRKVCDQRNTRTNLQIATIDVTRSGKEHPRAINETILRDVARPGMYEEASASAAALHGYMEEQGGVGMMMWDEFGDFLALARSKSGGNTQAAQMVTAMTKMYSASNKVYKAARYADNKKQVVIDQPHFVLFASSSPEMFWKHVTSDYLAGGFMGRMLLFPGRGAGLPNSNALPSTAIPQSILSQVKRWLAFQGDVLPGDMERTGPRTVPHTPEAWARYVDHEYKIAVARIKEDPIRSAMWGGTAENTAKLAILFACSRSAECLQITLPDVELAIALSNWLTEQKVDHTERNVAETQSEKDYALIDRITLAAGSKGIAAWVLNRKLRSIQPFIRDRYLLDMLANGHLDAWDEATGGTPKRFFRHIKFRQYDTQAVANSQTHCAQSVVASA